MRRFLSTLYLLVILVALAFELAARADGFNPLYRGFRQTLLGGAYTAVADDEETLWLNPAGLAGIKRSSFQYFNSYTEISGDIVSSYSNTTNLLKGFNTSSLNLLIGKNIYSREQVTPTLVMPGFGLGFLIDGQAALRSQNSSFPQLDLGYQTTNGIQAGWGMTVFKRGKSDKATSELRVGVAGKWLYRRGGYQLLSLTQALNEQQNLLGDTFGDFRHGFGFDLGTQFVRKLRNLTISVASAYTEIGNINFGNLAATQVGDWSVGGAVKYDLRAGTSVLLAYDYRYLNVAADYRKKQHIGIEFSVPLLSIYGGLNQTYLTYGAAFDLWLLRFYAGSYAEELGTIETQEPERRYMLGLLLKIDL